MLLIALVALAQGDLDKATEQAAGAAKQAFKLTLKVEGPTGGNWPLECKADGELIEMGGGKLNAFKKGDMIVWREGKTWVRLSTERKDTMQLLRLVTPPAAMLKGIGAKLKDAKADEKKDKEWTVWKAELNDAGAKEFALQPGGTTGEVKCSGRARFWIDAEGSLAKFEIVAESRSVVKMQGVLLRTTRTVELKKDDVTIEIPAEAKKFFEED